MLYRKATVVDAPVLAQMNYQLIRDEGHRNRMSVTELEERMRSWLDEGYQSVLFEDEKGIAGYALYKWETGWVYVRQFFIQPPRRRQGIGRGAWAWLRIIGGEKRPGFASTCSSTTSAASDSGDLWALRITASRWSEPIVMEFILGETGDRAAGPI